MKITIIGIDCAVQAKNVGLARGFYVDGRTHIDRVMIAGGKISIAEIILDWISASPRTLFALDAPLGWPALLGETLHAHQAGDLLEVPPNQIFRRATDRFVKHMLGKQPLDVGADRIARTAHAALQLLAEIQSMTGSEVSLAWRPGLDSSLSAVEVYPAATLISHGIAVPGYKQKENRAVREQLLAQLQGLLDLPRDTSLLVDRVDALDAAICVLAGADFLGGQVYQPLDIHQARKEGWIWVKKAS
jgi:predicted RNase H-like nuclease